MDVYWSIEVCGWVRCPKAADPLVTPWTRPPPEPVVLAPVPEQRPGQAARAPR